MAAKEVHCLAFVPWGELSPFTVYIFKRCNNLSSKFYRLAHDSWENQTLQDELCVWLAAASLPTAAKNWLQLNFIKHSQQSVICQPATVYLWFLEPILSHRSVFTLLVDYLLTLDKIHTIFRSRLCFLHVWYASGFSAHKLSLHLGLWITPSKKPEITNHFL